MARAEQQVVRDKASPEDLVSIGMLAKVFPRHVIDGVVQATCVHEKCQRLLPTWLVLYYVLGHALFMDLGGGRLISKLAGTLVWKGRGEGLTTPFSTGSVSNVTRVDSRCRNQIGATRPSRVTCRDAFPRRPFVSVPPELVLQSDKTITKKSPSIYL